MRHSIRRQFFFLRAGLLVTSTALVVLAVAAFRQVPKPQNLGEITVERINIVDAGGTLRLVISNKEQNGVRRADAGLMFDQLKQDQTIGFSYTENNGRRTAGFQVWDRSDRPLSELIEQLNAANKIQDRTERDAALAAIRAKTPPGPRRVFVGKTADRSSTVELSDPQGKPRLTLTVDSAGNPRIEFLDESGKVTARLPEK